MSGKNKLETAAMKFNELKQGENLGERFYELAEEFTGLTKEEFCSAVEKAQNKRIENTENGQ